MTYATPLASEQITQEDREAAASNIKRRLVWQHGGEQPWMDASTASMRMGEQDDHEEVQAFARHRIAALSASPAPSGQGVWGAQGAEIEQRARALSQQLRGVMRNLTGQAYSSTLSALNHLDAVLSGACGVCDGSGYVRHLGCENTEIVENCFGCAAPAPSCAPGEVTKADRDLYARLCPDLCSLIYGGDLDRFGEMQAIVAFREAVALSPQGLDAKEGGE